MSAHTSCVYGVFTVPSLERDIPTELVTDGVLDSDTPTLLETAILEAVQPGVRKDALPAWGCGF